MGFEMNVNFDAQTATDTDFHGIKRLLQQLFLKVLFSEGDGRERYRTISRWDSAVSMRFFEININDNSNDVMEGGKQSYDEQHTRCGNEANF